jgi:DNA-binding MarR family transcriptional regulator
MGADAESPDFGRLSGVVDALAGALGSTRTEAIDQIESFLRVTSAEIPIGARLLRAIQRIRLRRNEWMGVDLFRDPAWDMLLELIAARLENRALSVSALCFASGVPQTTALRHIDRMAEAGVIVRTGDSDDHRRILVSLTDAAIPRIDGMIREMRFSMAAVSAPVGATAADRTTERP